MLKHVFSAIFFASSIAPLLGQGLSGVEQQQRDTLSSRELATIMVADSRLSHFTQSNITDTVEILLQAGMSVAQQLEMQTSLFVKSYGVGSLATTSLRGGSASHTAVLWHGLNLQSPMNGTVDLALLPRFATDSIAIQYGGNSALWGSGAVGGSIHLHTSLPTEKGMHAQVWGEAGSFGNFQQGMRLSVKHQNHQSKVNLWRHTAENDFSFTNRAKLGNPEERLANAASATHGVTWEHRINGRNSSLELAAWWQQSEREIPPSMVINQSQARQNDDFFRLTAGWHTQRGGHTFRARTALLTEYLQFSDPAISLNSQSQAQQIISELQHETLLIGRVQWLNGVHHTYEQAKTDNYEGTPQRHRLAWASSFRWNNYSGNFTVIASGRQEWNSTTGLVPFVPSLGVVWALSSRTTLRANVNRSFRLPTFNDLFWQPGGNLAVEPEKGWAQELSLHTALHRALPRFEVVLFNRNLQRQIVWQPTEKGYWSAFNLHNVWVRGAEFSLGNSWKVGAVELATKARYQWLKADSQNNDGEAASVIYTPEHQARWEFSASKGAILLQYQHQWTGQRLTTPNRQQALAAYDMANLTLRTNFQWRQWEATLGTSCLNLWDTSYEVIAWRPMPGRNYAINLLISFP